MTTERTAPDYRALVEALPSDLDGPIDDAMVGVEDRGIREDDDPELFWREVYEEVTNR